MKIVDNIGESQVVILKVEQEDLNALLINFDLNDDGATQYMYQEFAEILMNNVPEYAFAYHKDCSNPSKMVEYVREAAKTLMKMKNIALLKKYFDENTDENEWDKELLDDYLKTGVFGELILHFLLKEFKGTTPLVSKIYLKDSFSHEAHGFDSVHVAGDTLWLGEAKFYSDAKGGIRELVSDINSHLTKDYLNEQFLIIKRGLDNSVHPEREKWVNTLVNTKRLSEKFNLVCIPLLCVYSSNIPSQMIENSADEFNAIYLQHIDELKKYFDKKNTFNNKEKAKCVLMLLPIEDKKTIIKMLLEKIVRMQGV